MPEPFGIDGLRASVLRAWRDSPTRFTEDTNAEYDLRVGGYRDRLFVELAQNAADAAAQAGVPGRIRVSIVDGELRVANTGAPLDDTGVAALASLRASGKRAGTVGRFGVGFAAVLAVTSAPRLVSRTGGVAFAEDRTREVVAAEGRVPILRLPWPLPVDEPPLPEGFDTEVRLPLSVEAGDVLDVLDGLAAEVPDLLLALPWLSEVDLAGRVWTRSDSDGVVTLTEPGGGSARWLTHGEHGCVWAVPVDGDGGPRPLGEDVLHTPTPTDERLSLPARLLAPVPVEPSRRRVLPEADGVLAAAAAAYPGLVRRVPAQHRLALVPAPTFPLSEVDTRLRELVVAALADQAWLPAAAVPSGGTAVEGRAPTGETEVEGRRARVLDVDSSALAGLLADVVPGLVAPGGPHAARVLSVVGAQTLDIAGLVDAVTGVARPPSWWVALYDALLVAVEQRAVDTGELGALPVPLVTANPSADGAGRTVPGPRGVLLLDDVDVLGDGVEITGLHVVHPDARHPLLERLGATRAGPGELLAAPALREAVARSVEDAVAGIDVLPLADTVLRLAQRSHGEGLGALALPARSGWRRADELVHPGSALLDLLDADALGEEEPLDLLDASFAARWPLETLTAVGVLDTFAVVGEDDEPYLRDLDLVADDAWPAAIRLLAARPETWRVLSVEHTRRWLSHEAVLASRAPCEWRLPSARALAGLYDPVPDVGLSEDLLRLVGVRADLILADADDAEDLCARLGDPARTVPPGLVLRAYAALAASGVDPEEIDPPDSVRALDGSVVGADDAVVLDAPWLSGYWPLRRLVGCSDYEAAPTLAASLDLPLAGDETTAEVARASHDFVAWRDLPALAEAAELLGCELPEGGLVLHEELTVGETAVPWWFDGTLHASDTSEGLASAFAWAADRWPQRLLIAALLEDPDVRQVL